MQPSEGLDAALQRQLPLTRNARQKKLAELQQQQQQLQVDYRRIVEVIVLTFDYFPLWLLVELFCLFSTWK